MKIYLAIPYTGIEKASFIVANRIAGFLMEDGHIVYSSISHSHPIAIENNLYTFWDFWKKQDEEFIKWCDEVHVIKLDGLWRKSKGVQAEIALAKKYNKKVKFI